MEEASGVLNKLFDAATKMPIKPGMVDEMKRWKPASDDDGRLIFVPTIAFEVIGLHGHELVFIQIGADLILEQLLSLFHRLLVFF